MDQELPSLEWFVFSKVVVYTTLILILILTITAVKYGFVNDFPICKHRHQTIPKHITETLNNPLATESQLQAAKTAMTKVFNPISGCGGHHPNSIDIGSLKTGDLMIISYQGLRSWFSALMYNSAWTHPGLVYIDKISKEPYILEAAAYSPPYIGQIIRIPLLKWMYINRNARAIAHLRINKEVDVEKVDEGFKRFETEDVGVEGLRWGWFRFLKDKTPNEVSPESFFAAEDRRIKPKTKTKAGRSKYWPLPIGKNNSSEFDYMLTCHEVVINTLQHAGVFDGSKTACSYLPNSLYKRDVPTINGYVYSEPEEISFDNYVSNSASVLERVCI